MENPITKTGCTCGTAVQANQTTKTFSGIKKAISVIPSFFTSLIIAFFPKCPFCWAVYMSMFGALGLTKLPYMPWLLPLLLLFLGLHLFMIFRKASQKGYLPFSVSLTGSLFLVFERLFYPAEQWAVVIGMMMIISGSLLNSFLNAPVSLIAPASGTGGVKALN